MTSKIKYNGSHLSNRPIQDKPRIKKIPKHLSIYDLSGSPAPVKKRKIEATEIILPKRQAPIAKAQDKHPVADLYGLPPRETANYAPDVSIEERSLAVFQKRWGKHKDKLVSKNRTVFQKKARKLIEQIIAQQNDGPLTGKIEIRKVDRKTGRGVFTNMDIPSGTPIGIYSGTLRHIPLSRDEEFSTNTYLFGFPGYRELLNFYIDAEKDRNFTGYFNHAPADSEACNLYATYHFENDVPRVVFATSRDVKAGEELRFDYEDEYWKTLGVDPVKV